MWGVVGRQGEGGVGGSLANGLRVGGERERDEAAGSTHRRRRRRGVDVQVRGHGHGWCLGGVVRGSGVLPPRRPHHVNAATDAANADAAAD